MTLGESIYALVHQSALCPKAIADRLGVRAGYLLDAANPDRDDTHFQARWIVPITLATGNDALIRHLAEACGGLFVRLTHQRLTSDVARIIREFGEFLEEVGISERDGQITPAEVDRVRREANEAVAAILAHVDAIAARAATTAPTARTASGGRR